MKRSIAMVLFLGAITNAYAQNNSSDKFFEVPKNIIIAKRFFVQLDKNNRMQVDLTDLNDLAVIANIDSLLGVFIHDIEGLKDSIADPLTAKRIDYFTDAANRKKVRFQQFSPKGASFLLMEQELSTLRTEQDTINIIGIIPNPPKPEGEVSLRNPRYYHLVFYLNSVNDLSRYLQGPLQQKLQTIREGVHKKWPHLPGGSHFYMQADKDITAEKRRGSTANAIGDYINGFVSVNVQNYKSFFVPSFTVGTKLVITNRDRSFKWETGLAWEPHFLFRNDSSGKLRTYRNDFLTLTYGQGGTTDYNATREFSFSAVFSLGYLVYRQGDLIEKNTFRMGAGKIQLYKTTIEPSFYFTNLFRQVTPCIRIAQTF